MGDLYRYTLRRTIDPVLFRNGGRVVVFVMLNPSTADARLDDPTIRRCVAFAKRDKAAALHVVNLYAFRATDPSELAAASFDVVGPENDAALFSALRMGRSADCRVVLAWGAHAMAKARLARFDELHLVAGRPPTWCLGRTADGSPRHPLFVRADQPFELFDLAEASRDP